LEFEAINVVSVLGIWGFNIFEKSLDPPGSYGEGGNTKEACGFSGSNISWSDIHTVLNDKNQMFKLYIDQTILFLSKSERKS
jgi:hypothetical protein